MTIGGQQYQNSSAAVVENIALTAAIEQRQIILKEKISKPSQYAGANGHAHNVGDKDVDGGGLSPHFVGGDQLKANRHNAQIRHTHEYGWPQDVKRRLCTSHERRKSRGRNGHNRADENGSDIRVGITNAERAGHKIDHPECAAGLTF